MNKFEDYSGVHRNINVDKLKNELSSIDKTYNNINSTHEFDLKNVPDLS
jgi:hypothetical protein